jgi:hypothetical protein
LPKRLVNHNQSGPQQGQNDTIGQGRIKVGAPKSLPKLIDSPEINTTYDKNNKEFHG